MKYWAFLFFLIAIAAASMAFNPELRSSDPASLTAAKIIFYAFSVLGMIALGVGTRNDEK